MYDFLENENTEARTNGHTEDLLGTIESNDIDLLSNSGPIVSDDSGVTMDTNHLDGTQEVEEGQRNGETSEESDIQVDLSFLAKWSYFQMLNIGACVT